MKMTLSKCLTLLAAIGAATQLTAAEPDRHLADAAMNRDFAQVSALLSKGVDPNSRGEYDTPALLWLVEVDEVATAGKLIKAGADVNITSPLGVTPLKIAVENGSEAMVSLLLKAGAKPNTLTPEGETPLMIASAVGESAVVKALIASGADVNALDPNFGQTALMVASREGHADIVAQLLKAGAKVNVATKVFPAPAFVKPNSQPGFGFGVGIIRGGTPADRGRREPQQGGMTPLLFAARQGHVEAAKLLLQAGADLNARESNDIWPLLIAISNNNMPMAEFLLQQKGVLINGQDWYGRSPIWEAVNVRNLYMHNSTFAHDIDRPPVLELIKHLLAAGADPNVRTKETPPVRNHLLPTTGTLEWVDFTGQTPFLTAALAGDVTVMKLLLQYKADPKIETFRGTSALMAAAGVNWVYMQTWTEGEDQLLEAVKMCQSLGMDINQRNSMGINALMGAANRGSDKIIRYLVEQGADLTVQDNEKRTALDWAKGVFLATHPAEQKPSSMALLTSLLQKQGKEVR